VHANRYPKTGKFTSKSGVWGRGVFCNIATKTNAKNGNFVAFFESLLDATSDLNRINGIVSYRISSDGQFVGIWSPLE
jgi:hypothetical protein